jgi:GntR family transcriptional regulator/MocR family aminotransferase
MTRASSASIDEARGARELLLDVDLRRGRLRRSIRDSLRAAIQDGRLTAGSRLPSSRQLAAELSVSRGVTSDAYDQLVSEGYLEVRPRSAPTVAQVAGAQPPRAEPERPAAAFDFVAETPDVSLFPRRAWGRALERALRGAPDLALDYGDHRGRPELRVVLSDYLARVRGVRVPPGRIVVTQGFTQALDLLCRTMAARGRATVAIETPSLSNEWTTIRESRVKLVACPVDGDGIVVDRLAVINPDAVVVTPAHHYPTGAVLAPARRSALVAWARRSDGLVIEDDYDAEFRYDRTPVGAVQGLDPGRVAHAGTASKTLAPGMRLGWISLPPDLVDDVREHKAAADSGSPALDQLALAELMRSGDYERHVTRTRHEYRRRRDRLVRSLREHLPGLAVRGAAAGMHVYIPLAPDVDDTAIVDAAGSAGIRVRALSPLHLEPSDDRGLLLGYGRMSVARIDEGVARLARVLRAAGIRAY